MTSHPVRRMIILNIILFQQIKLSIYDGRKSWDFYALKTSSVSHAKLSKACVLRLLI